MNGRKVNIPSFQVKVGDEIKVRENSKKHAVLEARREFASHQHRRSGCRWIPRTCPEKCLRCRSAKTSNLPVNEQLIVELYSK